MLFPNILQSLEADEISKLGIAINAPRGSEKLGEKEVQCLATGVKAILEIIGKPKLLDELEVDDEFSKKRIDVAFGSPTDFPAEVLVSSAIEKNSVFSTVGITNKRNNSALLSLIAQVTQDKDSKQITNFVACVVTDDSQENDKPLVKRMLNKVLKATGITSLLREIAGVYHDPDTIYTAITYSSKDQQFHVSSKSATKADVPIPLSLSMLCDVDDQVITDRLQEIADALLY